MPISYNRSTGLWEEEDEITGEKVPIPVGGAETEWQDTTMEERSAMRVLPYNVEERLAAEREQQLFEQQLAAGEGRDNRPVFAQGPGQFLGDLTKIAVNVPLGLATDLVDIATTGVKIGPGQIAGIAGDISRGVNPFTPERGMARMMGAFDESQNPLTRWRRDALRTDTQAGNFVSNIARLATPAKLLTAPLKAVGVLKKLDKVGDVTKFASPEALKAVGLVDNVTPSASRAIKGIANAPNRRVPFKAVAEAAKRDTGALAVKNRWQGLETQVSALKANLGIGSDKKTWFKSASEFLAWDLFMAYNVAGEGDRDLDETLGDALQEWTGIGNPLATDWTDNALTLKLKQMGDAAIGGMLVGGVVDLFRVQRYARNFSNATAVEQRKILDLFDVQTEDIGARVTNAYQRPLLPTSNITTRGGALARQGGPEVDYPVWRQVIDDYSNRLEDARAGQRQLAPGQPRLDGMEEVQVAVVDPVLPGAAPTQPLLEGQFQLRGSEPVIDPALPGAAPTQPLLEGQFQLRGSEPLLEGQFQLRGSEPVIDPMDWTAMAREAFASSSGSDLERVMNQLSDLLPRERANFVDFIERITPTVNDLNLLPAPEQFAVNRLLRQGVSEGWVEFDANFSPIIRRGRAKEMDLADLDGAAGRDMDELARLRRTKEEGQNNLVRQALDEMDERATDELAVEEGVDADGLSMQGEYERFLQERPDGNVDEFREWLQEQDQLEWFLNESQRSGRVPPASQLDEVEVPPADARTGDVPETRPQAADPLDDQIQAAEAQAELSRQRADARLAQEADLEVIDAEVVDAVPLEIETPESLATVLMRLNDEELERGLRANFKMGRSIKRAQAMVGELLAEDAAVAKQQLRAAKRLQEADPTVQVKLSKAQLDELRAKYGDSDALAGLKAGNNKATLAQLEGLAEALDADYAPGGGLEALSPQMRRSMDGLRQKVRGLADEAKASQVTPEDVVVDDLDDFMRQMDENGEICLP